MTVFDVPVIDAVTVSVAVMVWLPEVRSIAEKLPLPLVKVALAGRSGAAVLLVKCGASIARGRIVELILSCHGEVEGRPAAGRGRSRDREVSGRPCAYRNGSGRAGDRRAYRVGCREGPVAGRF